MTECSLGNVMNETDRKIDEGTRKGRAERHSRGSVEYFQRRDSPIFGTEIGQIQTFRVYNKVVAPAGRLCLNI